MSVRKYHHKFKEVVTDKYVLRLEDKREDAPKSKPNIHISGLFREASNIEINSAYELRDALNTLLRGVKKTPVWTPAPGSKSAGGEDE